MTNREATEMFQRADTLFRERRFAEALLILQAVDEHFPNRRKVLFPMARCMAAMRREDEALALCDRVLAIEDYPKAADLKRRLLAKQREQAFTEFTGETLAEAPAEAPAEAGAEETETPRRRFPLFKLIILVALVALAYLGYFSYWVPAIAFGIWFIIRIVFRFVFNYGLRKLFEIPFRMKGRALAGATAAVHSVIPAAAPPPNRDADDDEDDEDAGVEKGPLNWYWIDLTITPQPRSSGFVHWEPSELAVFDATKKFRPMDDEGYSVRDVKIVKDGMVLDAGSREDGDKDEEEDDDGGGKYIGELRLKLLVGVPPGFRRGKFVYYFEPFGEFELPGVPL